MTDATQAWTPINTPEAADRFIGKTVEMRAPACRSYRRHPTHGRTVTILRRDGGYLYLECDGERTGLSWTLRERIEVRPVADPTAGPQ